ncbi:MAG: hypothetical protein CMB66_00210 [Euryarchaeota archaeon]|nr:hypothetical protein [Euryarchaeota archaeon]|tara:strand:+ start:76 stop:627 length:552 start_codon:yes stop_codon:yes gene_type:complete
MVSTGSRNLGGLYLKLGSREINLADFTKEADDQWLRITPQDTWSSTLSRVRIARQEAIENSLESIRTSGFPDRGSSFRRLIDSCGIEKKSDVVLASIQYLRSVEKEGYTQPRDLKRLIEETGKWTKRSVRKWNLSIYISRMLERGSGGSAPFLEYPRRKPRKNGYVVLTEAGRDHLDKLSLGR